MSQYRADWNTAASWWMGRGWRAILGWGGAPLWAFGHNSKIPERSIYNGKCLLWGQHFRVWRPWLAGTALRPLVEQCTMGWQVSSRAARLTAESRGKQQERAGVPHGLKTCRYSVTWDQVWALRPLEDVRTHSLAASEQCPELLVHGEQPQREGTVWR